MAQLTLKVLQNDTNEALTDLEQRITENEARVEVLENRAGEDEPIIEALLDGGALPLAVHEDIQIRLEALENPMAHVFQFDGEGGEPLQITVDAPAADVLPAWGIEIVEALIEALKGVRLQGAQQFALALEAKYFPTEEVEEEEVTA